MTTVAIDDGFATTVGVVGERCEVMASLLQPALGDGPAYSIGGERIEQTEAAQAYAARRMAPGYHGSEQNRVLVAEMLRRLGVTECDLIVGLPLADYLDRDGRRAAKARAFAAPLPSRDGETPCALRSVTVRPQGAFVPVASGAEGRFLVIDLGSQTLDVASGVIVGGTPRYEREAGHVFSADLGVWAAVRRMAAAAVPVEVGIERALDAWATGALRLGGRSVDVRPARTEATAWLAREVVARLANLPGWQHYDSVTLIGGGADLVADAVRARFCQAHIPAEPVAANARAWAALADE